MYGSAGQFDPPSTFVDSDAVAGVLRQASVVLCWPHCVGINKIRQFTRLYNMTYRGLLVPNKEQHPSGVLNSLTSVGIQCCGVICAVQVIPLLWYLRNTNNVVVMHVK